MIDKQTCDKCGEELTFIRQTASYEHKITVTPGDRVELWTCANCGTNWFVHVHISLDLWLEIYGPRLQKPSRSLWQAIRREFDEQGPPMTVRQMFYRMSSAGMVAKSENGYRQVQYALTAMRRAGAIPYGWLADNTRWVRKPDTYSGLDDALDHMHKFYRRSLWQQQRLYIEIWLEKDALAGVISDITSEYDVPLYVTRGYPSLSYLHEAAESIKSIGKPSIIYHFGDYDASGQDAARAIRDGLRDFGASFDFQQVAVTPWQISHYSLQTRPAKKSDPRAARHGDIAVELDAIPPAELRRIVRGTIEDSIDPAALEMERQIEQREKSVISDWIQEWKKGA